ncbi:PLP-dependent transferase [Nadsonia fulvescens var. elongata DSM 6958]|uniref:PLP-dependent transferase n=1 Tax=Nadsonia fulvescens var. elongata DSM 6958 TaxID=857566 RepID=A0A1E3PMF0_9ASCO|nr:PLP-dependent transferase [Nadsonia fulvescens var. elongata DSM 6958]
MCPTDSGLEGSHRTLQSETGPLYQSASGTSTPIPLPEVYTKLAQREPGLDAKQVSTGVVWATERAEEKGYRKEDPSWINFGQGAPESGPIPGCFDRPTSIPISEQSKEYGSTAGIKKLRHAVAELYNNHYREGKESQYTYENVCIVPGGRAGLIRIASILQDCYLSFFFPDYTAYSEMLSLFKNFSPIPVPLDETDKYHIHLDIIKAELHRGVTALLTSNPRNPTGQCLRGNHLQELQDMCRKSCLLIMDEFYSRYNYTMGCDGSGISAASNVIDVNEDHVLIIDGLTKAFRLPGWRVCWIVGPKSYIKALSTAGSYLDGGCNVPFQEAAVSFLEPNLVKREMAALQVHFKTKRDYCIDRLQKMGFVFKYIPDFTFYIWLDLSPLPARISTAMRFFQELLKEKTIVVPGFFFDLNPLARREVFDSPMFKFVRLSYGPEMGSLVKGMDAIERVINKHKKIEE